MQPITHATLTVHRLIEFLDFDPERTGITRAKSMCICGWARLITRDSSGSSYVAENSPITRDRISPLHGMEKVVVTRDEIAWIDELSRVIAVTMQNPKISMRLNSYSVVSKEDKEFIFYINTLLAISRTQSK